MFDLKTEPYHQSVERLPPSGQQIIGYQNDSSIVVYQAYKRSTADFAAKNQVFGGDGFSYNRMSWIKPNFLWMMFRCGWAEKEGQEGVLAITLSKTFFLEILSKAIISSFNTDYYSDQNKWKEDLSNADVRLQWDPDHDALGNKITRRAIQLGLKGEMLERYGKSEIISIRDITPFVVEQKKLLDYGNTQALVVPHETIFQIDDANLATRIGIRLT
ncbi:DUF4291 domain-containing protein [Chryseolinea sp. T2]|uniref:DUF4291 domain-containing protein n=1 Tax=Chryseolinea sp. T2 TaxID=3129255 RepID=UPI003077D61C